MNNKKNAVDPTQISLEVFGFDVAEISQIRRIQAFTRLGFKVHSFTMKRANMVSKSEPDWPNTHLYVTENNALPKRAWVIVKSIFRMLEHRPRLKAADVIVARNLDMLVIALAGKALSRSRAKVIYECLDIHTSLTGDGKKPHLMRWAERKLLKHVDLLAISSPGFIRNYFEPLQKYSGPSVLWENKLVFDDDAPARALEKQQRGDSPLKIGWIGTIRCAPSLEILAQLAQARPNDVEIHIHGIVHAHALPDFEKVLQKTPNMHYHGPYEYPGALLSIYGSIDLVWSQDLWQSGGNSDWLLPNRIYEASYCGCPSLAVTGTETGHKIETDALGWVIPAPKTEALLKLLSGLSREEIHDRHIDLLQRPDSEFVFHGDELKAPIMKLVRSADGS